MSDALPILLVLLVLGFVLHTARKQAKLIKALEGLSKTGIPARALLLEVSSTRVVVRSGWKTYERRKLTIDLEISGSEPCELSLNQLIPAHLARYVLPGASLEVRVDPKDPKHLAIVGPCAGFSPAFTEGLLSPELFLPSSQIR